MIRIRNLNKTYFGASPLHVLKGINLDVEEGEFMSIVGSSGSGKSTLLNILGILDTYDTGDYYLDNVLIKNLSETKAAEVRNKKIGFIFQSFNLIPFKNAMENVALPLYYQGVSRKKRNILALEYLDKMGLKSHADHLPNELSGGQKQRVAIARALIAQPQIILADEPTGALDSKTSKDVMRILRDLNTNDGITMIIVTHEQAVAEATDRVIHIKDGIINKIEDRRLIHLNKLNNTDQASDQDESSKSETLPQYENEDNTSVSEQPFGSIALSLEKPQIAEDDIPVISGLNENRVREKALEVEIIENSTENLVLEKATTPIAISLEKIQKSDSETPVVVDLQDTTPEIEEKGVATEDENRNTALDGEFLSKSSSISIGETQIEKSEIVEIQSSNPEDSENLNFGAKAKNSDFDQDVEEQSLTKHITISLEKPSVLDKMVEDAAQNEESTPVLANKENEQVNYSEFIIPQVQVVESSYNNTDENISEKTNLENISSDLAQEAQASVSDQERKDELPSETKQKVETEKSRFFIEKVDPIEITKESDKKEELPRPKRKWDYI